MAELTITGGEDIVIGIGKGSKRGGSCALSRKTLGKRVTGNWPIKLASSLTKGGPSIRMI